MFNQKMFALYKKNQNNVSISKNAQIVIAAKAGIQNDLRLDFRFCGNDCVKNMNNVIASPRSGRSNPVSNLFKSMRFRFLKNWIASSLTLLAMTKRSKLLLFLTTFLTFLILLTDTSTAFSQSINVDFSGDKALSTNVIQFFILLTVLSIAPGIIMMITCFPFIVTVLSILRQAMGVPQTPPNMMIMSLAIFLTFYVMQPIFEESWNQGITPYIEGIIDEKIAFEKTIQPLQKFMEQRVSVETSEFMHNLSADKNLKNKEIPLSILIPAYMITEIERAFKVGFLIFIPFVIIDLVVAALLMSLGMMMLPPASISLPIKLAFFTLSNGWSLLATTLVKSYTG